MKRQIFLLIPLFFSFFIDSLGMGNAASRSMARIRNNLERRIAEKKYDECSATHKKSSKSPLRTLENNKPLQVLTHQNSGEANPAVNTLGTLVLGLCAAYASGKAQNPEPQVKQSLSEEELFHQMIQQNYAQDVADKNNLIETVKEQSEVACAYGFDNQHIEERLKALESIDSDKLRYQYKKHHLSAPVSTLLDEHGLNKNLYSTCYGNQLQQELHQECLSILENTAALSISSPLYDYKPELVGLANGAREYNQQGLSRKAIIVLDVCWSLLDYGAAIIEGVAEGVFDVARGIVEHPFQTAFYLIAGEYVLAYQLSKMLVEVAQIGLISCIDPVEGNVRWQEYTEPLSQAISAIASKELTVRGCIKATAYYAASYATQHKVLCTSRSLYQKAKTKVCDFVQKNPLLTPSHYMATPEGLLFKTVGSIDSKKSLKSIADYVGTREIVLPRVKTYEQARNKALKIIGEFDPHSGVPHIGNLGVGDGKIVGRRWNNGKILMRLDWDQRKGPHINVDDYRLGKGVNGIKVAIPFEGSLETVETLLKHMQR